MSATYSLKMHPRLDPNTTTTSRKRRFSSFCGHYVLPRNTKYSVVKKSLPLMYLEYMESEAKKYQAYLSIMQDSLQLQFLQNRGSPLFSKTGDFPRHRQNRMVEVKMRNAPTVSCDQLDNARLCRSSPQFDLDCFKIQEESIYIHLE
jgi:hypothetical protein